MYNSHLNIINDIADNKDISEIVLSFLDMEYLEKIHNRRIEERNSVKTKRWNRKKNHYDSYMYKELILNSTRI